MAPRLRDPFVEILQIGDAVPMATNANLHMEHLNLETICQVIIPIKHDLALPSSTMDTASMDKDAISFINPLRKQSN